MSNKKPAQLVKPTRFETALDFSTPAAEEHTASEQAKASTSTIRLNAKVRCATRQIGLKRRTCLP